MDCPQFQEILHDLARYEGLDVATLREALEHAERCRSCDDLLEEADTVTAELRALAEYDAPRQAPASIETNLLAALAQSNASVRRRSRRRFAAASVLGIAAMGLFAIALSHRIKPIPDPVPSGPSAAATAPGNSANGSQPALADVQRDALSIFDDEDGSAASFVPLTETFDAASLDGDAVLRVALSRSDLANFGISPTRLGAGRDQQVLADLIVTSDGIPQAIRLLPR